MATVINFGCRLNNVEGKKIEEYLIHDDSKIIINSCAVTNETERQVKQTIRKLHKQHPEKEIIVTGCAVQISPDVYASLNEVNGVIDNINKLKPETWVPSSNSIDFETNIFDKPMDLRPVLQQDSLKVRESLVIQQGCNHRCTFCIIPFGRGNNRSFEPSSLINEVKRMIDHGVKEIVLTGVDISDYGSDFQNHYCMSSLIQDLLAQTSIPRIRLSSIDCVEIDEHFDEVFQDPRVMPHLHLSIQSGDDMILKRMKRRHNSNDIYKFIDHCRSIRPEVTFGADIIAGFPTETDVMFNNTFNLLTNNLISHLHVFPFSPKKDTPASRMPQVNKSIIKTRSKKLRELGEVLLKKAISNLKSPRKILIEQLRNGFVIGYDQNYIKKQIPMIGMPIGEIITA